MMELREYELGEIGKVQTGPFGSQLLNEQYVTGGTPIITVEHIKDFRISYQPFPSVTDEDKERLKRYTMLKGDVVFSRVGSVDLSALVTEAENGWLFSSRMLCLRPDTAVVDPAYLSYYLRLSGVRNYINRIAVGTTMPSINTDILKSIPVKLPDLDIQREMGKVLLSIDDRITNLRQQNRSLERLAQLLFKRWFVDFEFPNAQGLPYKSSGGAMQPSELGEIPEGWEVKPLKEVMRVTKGLSYKGDGLTTEGNGVPMHNLKSIQEGGGYRREGVKWYSGDYKERHVCVPGDIIVACTEQGERHKLIGFPAFVPASFSEGSILSTDLCKITLTHELKGCPHFAYYLLCSHLVRSQLLGHVNGTTVRHLATSGLEEPEVYVPNERTLRAYESLVGPIWQQIETGHMEATALERLRDALLPRLMSGDVRVTEARPA